MKRNTTLAAIALLGITAGVGSVYAAQFDDQSGENDALVITNSMANAKVNLGQAVTTAEQQVGGKASHAEFEHHHDRPAFDVEVVKGNRVMDVKVDAINGQVISARADQADHEDEHDSERED